MSMTAPAAMIVISAGVGVGVVPPSTVKHAPPHRVRRVKHGSTGIRGFRNPFAGTRVPSMRVGVLASGSGTILQALLDRRLPIVRRGRRSAVRGARDRPGAGVAAELVERTDFGPTFDRVAYTQDVVDVLERHDVDLVAIAGFGTILSKPFVDAFGGRAVNTHPALLPAFKGWHAVRDALAAG